jgi:hypothetical protein
MVPPGLSTLIERVGGEGKARVSARRREEKPFGVPKFIDS